MEVVAICPLNQIEQSLICDNWLYEWTVRSCHIENCSLDRYVNRNLKDSKLYNVANEVFRHYATQSDSSEDVRRTGKDKSSNAKGTTRSIANLLKSSLKKLRTSGGLITKSEFSNLLKKYTDHGGRDLPLPGLLAGRLFDMFDVDQSGGVDFEEFFNGVTAFSEIDLPTFIGFVFELYDLDRSRTLSMNELKVILDHVIEFVSLEGNDGSGTMYYSRFLVKYGLDAACSSPNSNHSSSISCNSDSYPLDNVIETLVKSAFHTLSHLIVYDNHGTQCPDLAQDVSLQDFIKLCIIYRPLRDLFEDFFSKLVPAVSGIFPNFQHCTTASKTSNPKSKPTLVVMEGEIRISRGFPGKTRKKYVVLTAKHLLLYSRYDKWSEDPEKPDRIFSLAHIEVKRGRGREPSLLLTSTSLNRRAFVRRSRRSKKYCKTENRGVQTMPESRTYQNQKTFSLFFDSDEKCDAWLATLSDFGCAFSPNRFFEKYQLLNVVGSGNYGMVYSCRAKNIDSSPVYAVKVMDFSDSERPMDKQRYLNEAAILRLLRQHPGSVNIVESVEGNFGEKVFVVMDYMCSSLQNLYTVASLHRYDGQDPITYQSHFELKLNRLRKSGASTESDICACILHEHGTTGNDTSKSHNKFINSSEWMYPWESLVRYVIKSAYESLVYLHTTSRNIAHRDIKPDNILIDVSNLAGDRLLPESAGVPEHHAARHLRYVRFAQEIENKMYKICDRIHLLKEFILNILPKGGGHYETPDIEYWVAEFQHLTGYLLEVMSQRYVHNNVAAFDNLAAAESYSSGQHSTTYQSYYEGSSEMSWTRYDTTDSMRGHEIDASWTEDSVYMDCCQEKFNLDGYEVDECMPAWTMEELFMYSTDISEIFMNSAGPMYQHEAFKYLANWASRYWENLLVSLVTVKLADFGFATVLRPDDVPKEKGSSITVPYKMRDKIGTPTFCAPEIRQGKEYGVGVDVWSLGMTTYSGLMYGLTPLQCCHDAVIQNHKVQWSGIQGTAVGGNICVYPCDEVSNRISAAAIDMLGYVLEVEPDQRPSATDVLKHRWFERSPLLIPEKVKDKKLFVNISHHCVTRH